VQTHHRRVIVGITGASGAVYAQAVVRELSRLEIETHLVITNNGRRLLNEELDMNPDEFVQSIEDNGRLILHQIDDVGASIASGTFLHDGMIIVPCSSNTLGRIASGIGSNLLSRAAAVTLKERRPLVLCHRETPLSLIDIENMRQLTLAGAVIAPANPGWYFNPKSLEEITEFIAARLLDAIGIKHDLSKRWKDEN